MKTKLLSIFIIGLFVAVAFQINTVTSESESKEEIKDTGINSFASCYIEVSGNIATIDWPRIIGTNMWKLIYFRPFFNDFAVVVFWRLVLDESTELSVYNKQGGDLLWQHDGLGYPQLRILGYFGDYIPTLIDDETMHIELQGSAMFILKNIKG